MTEEKLPLAAVIDEEDRRASIVLGKAKHDEYDYRVAGMAQQVNMVSNVKEQELEGDELVRRKDVEQLIKEKIEEIDNYKLETKFEEEAKRIAVDQLVNLLDDACVLDRTIKINNRSLEELLEEVQNQ